MGLEPIKVIIIIKIKKVKVKIILIIILMNKNYEMTKKTQTHFKKANTTFIEHETKSVNNI